MFAYMLSILSERTLLGNSAARALWFDLLIFALISPLGRIRIKQL